MQRILYLSALAAFVFGTSMFGPGCGGSNATRLYVLSPFTGSGGTHQLAAPNQGVALGVGPVQIPKYLDRPQIVTRADRNRLDIADFDHWAAPLEENVTKVLAQNLSVLIPTDRVTLFPWNRSMTIDYQVSVDVIRFEVEQSNTSVLVARWSVLRSGGTETLMSKNSSYSTKTDSGDYTAVVASMNRNLDDLSQEIAIAIKSLAQ